MTPRYSVTCPMCGNTGYIEFTDCGDPECTGHIRNHSDTVLVLLVDGIDIQHCKKCGAIMHENPI